MRSKEESNELKKEVKRLFYEGYKNTEIAKELGISEAYVRGILYIKDKELIKEWRLINEWYKKYKNKKKRRQQAQQMEILIPWDEYSKGTGWIWNELMYSADTDK